MNTPLKLARKHKGLTLTQVAQSVNSDAGNLSRIENGKQMPNKELSEKLVQLFNEQGLTELKILFPERYLELK